MSAPSLAPLEVASGLVFGAPRRPEPLPRAAPGADPRAAFEDAVRAALRRAPCLVSFSGGRDSSAVLALATRVARREGLPDPIPATNRVAAAPEADESAWQEAVVAHLELADWLRLEWTDELDALGPFARRVLRRHGLLWPFNVHFHAPLLERARGGSLLTGIGGDELFAAAGRDSLPAARRRALPHALRRRVLARRRPSDLPWLTARARRLLSAAAGAHAAGEPRAIARRLAWCRGQRYLGVGITSLGLLAADEDVQIAHPLADRAAWAAVVRRFPRGFAGRAEGMAALFGDLLPAGLAARSDKAGFDEVFCGPRTRALAAAWDGTGAPAGLVDLAGLKQHWTAARPQPQSLTLLQAAWCAASAADRLEQPLDRVGQ